MKKKTKVRKQRLNNLLLILLLTAVLLIMSTYAWFTSNKRVDIDGIDVKVRTSSGLQISANGIDWGAVVTKDELVAHVEYPDAVNQFPVQMEPVSTALELDDTGKLKMFYGDIKTDMDSTPTNTTDPSDTSTYGKYLISSIQQTDREGANGYYIAFDVFLKTEMPLDTLYVSGGVSEIADSDEYKDKGTTNAARIAIIKSATNAATDATSDIVQALSTVGGDIKMWEPNVDTHTRNGINNGVNLGWYTTSQLATSGATPLKYDALKTEFTDCVLEDVTTAKHPDYVKQFEPSDHWISDKSETYPSFAWGDATNVGLPSGISKLRVYMWIEGQDIDCENNASGTNIEFNLSFGISSFKD